MASTSDTIVRKRGWSALGARTARETDALTSRPFYRSPSPSPLFHQSAEVLVLTYGSLVRQLVADLDDVAAVNKQLDTM